MRRTYSDNQAPADAEIFSVSQLNREARRLLEGALPGLWVAGEISNLARPGSGHLYFSLKDADAQVRCAMFRGANRGISFTPEDGMQVMVQARVTIYEPRGSYQLVVEQMEEAGEGLLRRKFEELKARLSAEGLFAEEHKRPMPALPGTIGVVTSPTGAAIRDILHVLQRRYPAAQVIIYPTLVQGDSAAAQIAAAINTADQRSECDVLIVARGGGSLEDLWSFNEEIVARAIHACSIPVISGVGHEVDFTITDLVADVRAPTPSGAAELITPDCEELLRTLRNLDRRITLSTQGIWRSWNQQQQQLFARLQRAHPGIILQQTQQKVDDLVRQLGTTLRTRLLNSQLHFQGMRQRLRESAPSKRLTAVDNELKTLQQRLTVSMQRSVQTTGGRLAVAAGSLNAVNPLATLERGYAVIQDPTTGKVHTDAAQLKPGMRFSARLASGSLDAVVEKVRKD